MRDEVYFLCIFYKMILSFVVRVARHAESTRNYKYTVSLQYLKKELSYEVDSLHADEHGKT